MKIHILYQGFTFCGKEPRHLGEERWVRREEKEKANCERCKTLDVELMEFEAIQADPNITEDERLKKSLKILAERFGGTKPQ